MNIYLHVYMYIYMRNIYNNIDNFLYHDNMAIYKYYNVPPPSFLPSFRSFESWRAFDATIGTSLSFFPTSSNNFDKYSYLKLAYLSRGDRTRETVQSILLLSAWEKRACVYVCV